MRSASTFRCQSVCFYFVLNTHADVAAAADEGRAALFRINLRDIKVSEDVNEDELAKLTDGYSGADITNVCRDAALMVRWKSCKA